ncbi:MULTISPECIES: ATP-binding protein [Streptomyces]|uniref:ATP-binding protein n=1 Tax=Streptomyces griseosporeus TaxID=1910 RepID=A0ABV3KWH5_STRGS|nr:ATP-binding protein [Streptomyces actuosus]MBM4823975.1 ATP-binding protein [Streptomyces actuosus]
MPHTSCSLFGTPPEDGVAPWPTYVPLAPWFIHGHETLWVDIDSTPEALKTFRERLRPMAHGIRPGSEGHGHLVVVSGLSGTGKSSLLHRCVHELVQLLDAAAGGKQDDDGPDGERRPLWSRRTPARSTYIVGLDGSGNDGHGIGSPPGRTPLVPQFDMVIDRVLRVVAAELGKDPDFVSTLADPFLTWRALTDILEALDRRLVVIVPHIPWNDADLSRRFLRFCHDRSSRGVVFFVETTHTGVEGDLAFFTERERKSITHIQTRQLRADDWAKYLELWMALPDVPDPTIAIDEDVLEYRPDDWALASISTLQDCLRRLVEEALRHNAGHLRRHHVATWFEANRPTPDHYMRNPGAPRRGPTR